MTNTTNPDKTTTDTGQTAPASTTPATTTPATPAPDDADATKIDGTRGIAADPGDRPDDTPDGDTSNSEAARRRKELQTARAERDALTNIINNMRRAEVERIAAGIIDKPAALWKLDINPDDLLTDQGTIDTDKATQAITDAAATYGLTPAERIRTPAPDPTQGRVPQGEQHHGDRLAEALRQR